MSSKSQERYDTQLTTKKLSDGRIVHNSVLPKVIEPTIEDPIITADQEDRADIIANNVYGSTSDWWKLAAANKKFKGSLHFTPGQEIVIPKK
jgi:hypothetical protein